MSVSMLARAPCAHAPMRTNETLPSIFKITNKYTLLFLDSTFRLIFTDAQKKFWISPLQGAKMTSDSGNNYRSLRKCQRWLLLMLQRDGRCPSTRRRHSSRELRPSLRSLGRQPRQCQARMGHTQAQCAVMIVEVLKILNSCSRCPALEDGAGREAGHGGGDSPTSPTIQRITPAIGWQLLGDIVDAKLLNNIHWKLEHLDPYFYYLVPGHWLSQKMPSLALFAASCARWNFALQEYKPYHFWSLFCVQNLTSILVCIMPIWKLWYL